MMVVLMKLYGKAVTVEDEWEKCVMTWPKPTSCCSLAVCTDFIVFNHI